MSLFSSFSVFLSEVFFSILFPPQIGVCRSGVFSPDTPVFAYFRLINNYGVILETTIKPVIAAESIQGIIFLTKNICYGYLLELP